MSKRIQTIFSDETFEKLKDIAIKKGTTDVRGAINITMTLAVTIADFHSKLYPEYITTLKARNEITPEKIAEKRIALENAKESVRISKERDQNVATCGLIDDSRIINQDGKEYCEYPVYTMSSPHTVDTTTQREPLGLMNEELVPLQYQDVMGRRGNDAKKTIMKVLNKKKKSK